MKLTFSKGLLHGLPIGLGYLSVSFGFGILAVKAGLSVLAAVGMSASNVTSAGQAAGVGIIAAGGTLIEMILTQLTINIRYSLMGLALSQRLDGSFTAPHRLLASFGITDEIFAVASSRREKLTPPYLYGLILISVAGWVTGTLLGAVAGNLLPQRLSDAMGILLYGMFIALIVPAASKEKGIFAVCLTAVAISLGFYYLLPALSSGFAVILCALLASLLGAWLFPVGEEEDVS